MKKLMAVIAVVVAVAFGATLVAEAEQCPLLVKQLKERLLDWPDPIRGDMKKQIADAEKLRDGDCVKKCEEVAKAAGIKLEMKKP